MIKATKNTSSTDTSTEDLVFNTVISMYKDNKDITTASLKYSIKRPIPFPLIISTVKYWNELSTEEKNNLLISKLGQEALNYREKLLTENSTTSSTSSNNNSDSESTKHISNTTTSNTNTINLVSDEDFLNMNNKAQLLYLKQLLESILRSK